MEDQYTIADYKLNREQLALMLYPGYSEADIEIFKNFRDNSARAEKGFVVDIMGIRTRISSLVKENQPGLDGQLLGYPVPCDFHSEAIEWIGLAKSVINANNKYVAMELGAGIGTWSVSGAVMARLRGIKDIQLTAVEADPHHFNLMKQHFKDNSFDPDKHTLFEAAVGAKAGIGYWPQPADPTEDWGLRPIFNKGKNDKINELTMTDYRGVKFDTMRKVTVLSLSDLIRQKPMWNLVHIDIQGNEVDICRAAIHDLTKRVKWTIIATHSRKHDGDILELFASAGWLLEHEKPTRFKFWANHASLEAMTTHDGTQVWQNPNLKS